MDQYTFDKYGSAWDACVNSLILSGANIIALRGAGSHNGIARETADRILKVELKQWICNLPHTSLSAYMYDGDNDLDTYPDIGYIMGRLRDHWAGNVRFIAAQRDDWYSGNGEPIRNCSAYPNGTASRETCQS